MNRKQCEMLRIKPFSVVYVLVILSLLLTSCAGITTRPDDALWGKWAYTASEGGYPAFAHNLEFGEDGTLHIPGSTVLKTSELAFAVIAPGRIKISALDQSEVLNYELTGNTLKLFFSGGYNLYTRSLDRQEVSQETGDRDFIPTLLPTPATESALGWLIKEKMVITPENAHLVIELNSLGQGRIVEIIFSPDGQQLAVASNKEIYIYDIQSEIETDFIETGSFVSSVAFSPDGLTLASGSQDGTVLLWNAGSWEYIQVLETGSRGVFSTSYSPDGRLLASGLWGGTLLWDVKKGEVLDVLDGEVGTVNSLAFSPDGRILASGSNDGNVRIWDVFNGDLLHLLEGHTNYVSSVAFSSDGRTFASGGGEGTIRLWDTASMAIIRILARHDGGVFSVAFSPDGQVLASAGEDGIVLLWDVKSGKTLKNLIGRTDWIFSVTFSPDGKTLASSSQEGTIRLWGIP